MKKVQLVSIIVLIIALVIMVVNIFLAPLADWIIRVDGVILLIGIFFLSYSTVKCRNRSR